MLVEMNIYILKEDRNFKTFLKEDYTIGLDSCYIFTEKMLNKESNRMVIVVMESAYIRHS